MNLLITGKNVLITGAGRNIGRSIALEMADQGANIYFIDFNEKRCKNLGKELSSYPVKNRGFVFDITSVEDIDALCKILEENQIDIDILVNNVGYGSNQNSSKMLDSDEWDRVFATNIFGPLYLTERVSEIMIKKKIQGSILFISSIHQWFISRIASYSASKAAIGMLIKELSVELAPHSIRVNGIAPGYIAEDKKGRPIAHRDTPLLRSSINPSYIGRAAVYLSSDYFSKYTTGSVLKIDAGLSLYNHLVEADGPQPGKTGK
jgi:NAD(P)-dependent dehydrogenase (short-subunit alcohol dehydrogenase family)